MFILKFKRDNRMMEDSSCNCYEHMLIIDCREFYEK